MAFISVCSTKNLNRLLKNSPQPRGVLQQPVKGLRALLVWLCLLFAGTALANDVRVEAQEFVVSEGGYAVSADFKVELGQVLEEAVFRGVTLSFLIDFELINRRWYWFDEKLASRQMVLRLSYHALTRQYRVASGGLHQSFDTLDEALRVLSRVRQWQVIEKASEYPEIRPGASYRGALRFKLDITQLPKPFQINAVGSRDWHLSSDWAAWEIKLPPAEDK
ncbi:MAG: hypothetical protein BWY57_02037 [Betaproteobacteria bacterium ADurb.Bin341]|nr:MAG: hypothetical protein BWY57_02037 [Betaproteobacteria bacterium ADurb.Bin341]